MKLSILLFCLFWIVGFINAQKNNEELPYRKIPKYSEKINNGLIMARMVDELGYKYYWTSEGLNEEDVRTEFGSTNILYSLLDYIDQLSLLIASYVLNQPFLDSVYEEKSISKLRKRTLFNLKNASNALIGSNTTTQLPFWDILDEPISDVNWYCDQIISYRRKNGISCDERIDPLNKESKAELLEKSIGADGLTNNQWSMIHRLPIPSVDKVILMRKQARTNSTVLAELKKQRAAYVELGELEDVNFEPNKVGGKEYLFLGNRPNQILISISSDLDFINELIQWIVYINSGNEVGVDEIFMISEYRGFDNKRIYLNTKKFRNIVDQNGDTIRFELFPNSSDPFDLNNFKISRVLVNDTDTLSNEIVFVGRRINETQLEESQELKLIHIKNIKGHLLNRIISHIEYFRDYRNDAKEPTLLNLKN